ncbi:PfkB family carbohydrate kinase [Agrobacterium burrii]
MTIGAHAIAVLGNAFLDRILYVGSLPNGSGKMRVRKQLETGGGIAATAAATAALLGCRASLFSRIGDDAAGDEISRRLVALGIDVTGVRRFANSRSPQGTIIVDPHGERLGLGFMGEGWTDDASWLEFDKVKDAKAVLADYSWYQGAEAIFKVAKDNGATTVLDADVNDLESVRRLLPRADHVVFSERCLAAISGHDDPELGLREVSRTSQNRVSVTAGDRGFFWLDVDGSFNHLPAFQVVAVDTNGAGDVFHGAYTVGVAEGMSVREAGAFANATAALKCLKGSGWESIPTRSEVQKFLKGVVE